MLVVHRCLVGLDADWVIQDGLLFCVSSACLRAVTGGKAHLLMFDLLCSSKNRAEGNTIVGCPRRELASTKLAREMPAVSPVSHPPRRRRSFRSSQRNREPY